MKSLKTCLFNEALFFYRACLKRTALKNVTMGGLTPRSGTRILCQTMYLNFWYGKCGHHNYNPDKVKDLKKFCAD